MRENSTCLANHNHEKIILNQKNLRESSYAADLQHFGMLLKTAEVCCDPKLQSQRSL